MPKPSFDIVTTSAGAVSIRDNITLEIMHNPVGPWAEANALYVEQSQLARRLGEDLGEELVIFDVGLGAAANALAVLHCARAVRPRRPLRLISFEREMTLLHFALDHASQFAHFAGFEEAVRAILKNGEWREDGLIWELRHGDYNALIAAETHHAHLVYFDPYSPKKNVDMWNVATFSKTFAKCAPTAVLYTYSQSTPIRVALLLAGFYVGAGLPTGLKEQTTQASRRREDLATPLGAAWLERWGRSHAPNAAGAAPEDLDDVRRRVRAHPQFS